MNLFYLIFVFQWLFSNVAQIKGQNEISTTYTSGYGVPGGVRRREYTSLARCLQGCTMQSDCMGLDFNTKIDGCYFHSSSTICDELKETDDCVHMRMADCSTRNQDDYDGSTTTSVRDETKQSTASTTTTTTSIPTTTTTTKRPSTTTTVTTTTSLPPTTTTVQTTNQNLATGVSPTTRPRRIQSPIIDTSGYIFTAPGMYVAGGYFRHQGVRRQECLDACAAHPLCLAVDYTTPGGGCYFHDTDSYCGPLRNLSSSTHYKRVPCVVEGSNHVVEMYRGMYSSGNNLLCDQECTLETCMAMCEIEDQCVGVSINTTSGSCQAIAITTVCSLDQHSPEIIQVNLGACFSSHCLSEPCGNGGVCIEGLRGFTCQCPLGYSGPTCDMDIDECVSSPCHHGGTCIDQVDRYRCQCSPGFVGANCVIEVNECSSFPCANDGTCLDRVAEYLCACAPGFSGTNCEIDADDCIPDACQNGGTCVDGVNSFSCSCPMGFGGITCTRRMSTCWDDIVLVHQRGDLVIVNPSTQLVECAGLCYVRDSTNDLSIPRVDRGCALFSEQPDMEIGCSVDDDQRTTTCYCDTRRCNGLSVRALKSQILHLPLDGDLDDHSGMGNHAKPLSPSNPIPFDCMDKSTVCSASLDGSQCITVESLKNYVFGQVGEQPDSGQVGEQTDGIFMPRFTAVVAFRRASGDRGPEGIFGTTDFSGKDEPRFHIALGTPSHDFITAGLHADQESPRELNDYLARVAGEGWYLATLTYDGHQSGPGEELYFPSTVFYLDTQRGMGNSLVNIGNLTMGDQPVTIGCAGGNFFLGKIDEVRLFNDVISPEDLKALLAIRDVTQR